MKSLSATPMVTLAYALKALRDHALASRLLWLAAEGRMEVLADGEIGFWTDHPQVVRAAVKSNTKVTLSESIAVDPTWSGPNGEAAIWCSVAPADVHALEHDTRGVPRLVVNRFTVKLIVLDEFEEGLFDGTSRPRRKGPARLYPRLARRRAA